MTEKRKQLLAKALANCLHREIIEDCHTKYNISQEDMMAMNKAAVNKAKVFVDIMPDEKAVNAFLCLYNLAVNNEWDNPEETTETKNMRDIISDTIKGYSDIL